MGGASRSGYDRTGDLEPENQGESEGAYDAWMRRQRPQVNTVLCRKPSRFFCVRNKPCFDQYRNCIGGGKAQNKHWSNQCRPDV